MPAFAVIHGSYPGRVFVDHENSPKVAIVWAIGRWMYLEGNIATNQEKSELKRFFREIVMPDCKKRSRNWFEIYTNDSKQLEEYSLKEIDFLKVDKHYESVYTLNVEKFLQVAKRSKRNEEKVEFRNFDIIPESLEETSYVKNSTLSKKTVGVVIKRGNTILSIDKNNGFTFGKEYFIDIDTFKEEERKKGYATLAAIKIISYFLEKNMFPLWETTESNIPSQKLALKLGFEPMERYLVFEFRLK
ncbi:GNAT family N-acetyltransferase [Oceanobacillus sp. SE10311]|uniref:GNAT family N-acetyltransferase n=1 Tax=Oceanobacillus sp. SE10311 TaxID=3098289 RepID=UPI00300DFCA5